MTRVSIINGLVALALVAVGIALVDSCVSKPSPRLGIKPSRTFKHLSGGHSSSAYEDDEDESEDAGEDEEIFSCGNTTCRKGQECDEFDYEGKFVGVCYPKCRKPCYSTPGYNPVCGSDGKTYYDMCAFEIAQCEEPERNLKLVHMGRCRDDPGTTAEPSSRRGRHHHPRSFRWPA